MKPLLLLHHRADYNTNDMWAAAIKNGWSTQRIGHHPEELVKNNGYVRYYGNTLHVSMVKQHYPINFYPLDAKVLAESPLSKRKIKLMKLKDLEMPLKEMVFIKPVYEKFFEARVYKAGETIEQGSLPDDEIYVQEIVNIINEVRCFCLDGKINTASYYRISKEYNLSNLDDFRNTILDDMVKELAPYYPKGIVLDFGFTDKDEWLFIEPNESWASGIYNCDPNKCLEVISASQYN